MLEIIVENRSLLNYLILNQIRYFSVRVSRVVTCCKLTFF